MRGTCNSTVKCFFWLHHRDAILHLSDMCQRTLPDISMVIQHFDSTTCIHRGLGGCQTEVCKRLQVTQANLVNHTQARLNALRNTRYFRAMLRLLLALLTATILKPYSHLHDDFSMRETEATKKCLLVIRLVPDIAPGALCHSRPYTVVE